MDDNAQTTGVVEMAVKHGGASGPDDLLSTAEAAEVMGVTDSHVRRVIGAGELEAQRIGARSWVVRRADAEAWAKVDRKRGPKPVVEITVPLDQLAENLERAALGASKVPEHAITLALSLVAAGLTEGTFPSGADVVVTLEPGQVRFGLGRPLSSRPPVSF